MQEQRPTERGTHWPKLEIKKKFFHQRYSDIIYVQQNAPILIIAQCVLTSV